MLSNLKTLGKDTLVYGLSTVIARLLNFLLLPFYTHYLVPSEYGVIAIIFTYIAFANILFQYGMDQAYMRHAVTDSEDEVNAYFSTAQWTLLATTLLLSTGIVLGAKPLAHLAGVPSGGALLMRYAACILALDALTIIPFAELRLRRKKWTFVGIKTFNILINLAMNILFLGYFGFGIRGVFLAAMLASSTSLVLLAPLCAVRIRAVFDLRRAREMLIFGLPFIPAGIGAMMVQVIDRPILQNLTNDATVGIYQANYKLGILMMLFVTMFDQAWRPFFLEHAKDKDAGPLFGRVLTYFLTASIWIVAAISLFIGDIVRLPLGTTTLLHPDYWSGTSVVPVVLSAYVFHGAYINFMASITLSKRTDVLIWVTFLGAAANISANLILIPAWGMMGAAWATFISYAAMALCLYWMGRRVHPIPYEYKRILHLGGVAAVLAAIAQAASTHITAGGGDNSSWLFIRAGILALYPFALWATGFFTPKERKALAALPGNLF